MSNIKSSISLKTVNDLLEMNFFVPSYQRGYRWSKRQVKDLLNDIFDFKFENDNTKESFYCLQPIVIKECDDETKRENDLNGEWYEVIDGQQRITTIHIILTFFNKRFTDDFKKDIFSIKYETREKSEKFLVDLDEQSHKENIDFYHIYNSYLNIKEWFTDKMNLINNFEDKLLNKSKFIWYEIQNEIDSIDIFTRINMGKIPLTNAELIKALFLGKVKNEETYLKNIKLKRLQIATEWDQIEYKLQNDDFWYFIYNGEENYDTRIEYIFDIMKSKPKKAEEYYTFHKFNEDFESKNIDIIWLEVKKNFQILQDWYNKRKLYHYVGYLISVGENIKDIIGKSRTQTKIEFEDYLVTKIRDTLNFEYIEDFYNLEYKRDNLLIKKCLLLFNIQTLLNNDKSHSRFPFNLYKNEDWDIEHISSVHEEIPAFKQHKIDWIKDAIQFIDNPLIKEEAKQFLDNKNENNFESIFNKILDNMNKSNNKENNYAVNDISNLTLLDFKTNRGYGNAIFPVKRKTIIEKDKTGIFIPIATKNVFMKYYTDKISQMTFWGSDDSENYLNAMVKTLSKFLPNELTEEGDSDE